MNSLIYSPVPFGVSSDTSIASSFCFSRHFRFFRFNPFTSTRKTPVACCFSGSTVIVWNAIHAIVFALNI